ncbi:S-layer homology domain-containing protein [Phormidesmis priestleyi]
MKSFLITGKQRSLALAFLTALFTLSFISSLQAQERSPARLKADEFNLCSGSVDLSQPITRADIAQVLGSTVSWNEFRPIKLKDVRKTHPAYFQIQQAIALKWMSADGNGRFFPNRLLTRDEGFAILVQAAGVAEISQTAKAQPFSAYTGDPQAMEWSKPNLAIALTQGIVNTERGIRPRDLMRWQDLCYGLNRLATIPDLPVPPSRLEVSSAKTWGIIGAIGVGAIGLILIGRKPSKPTSTLPQPLFSQANSETIRCLQVTEQQVSASGQVKVLAQNETVLLFPASFGDQTCTYIVKSLPSVEGRLFTIAISPEGDLSLMPHPQKSLVCNGFPVPIEGIRLEKHAQSKIEYQRSHWLIQPSCDIPQRKTSAAYFAQLNSL